MQNYGKSAVCVHIAVQRNGFNFVLDFLLLPRQKFKNVTANKLFQLFHNYVLYYYVLLTQQQNYTTEI
jgi:hypothetical protein